MAPALVERGKNDSVLMIAFTGAGEELGMPVYEFFDVTKSLGYGRILLRDQYRQNYHRGIDKQRPDFPSLILYLRQEIERLSPKKVLCIGTSAGGYAAIRAGHQLHADYVQAFGPVTGLLPPNLWPQGKHHRGSFMDLAEVLKEWNQKTIYYIHYCCGFDPDRYHAERLSRSPGVVRIGYPCNSHQVAIFLAKKGLLTEALAIANQDRVGEIAKAYFGEDLELHGLQPDMTWGSAE